MLVVSPPLLRCTPRTTSTTGGHTPGRCGPSKICSRHRNRLICDNFLLDSHSLDSSVPFAITALVPLSTIFVGGHDAHCIREVSTEHWSVVRRPGMRALQLALIQ